eukprot:TRINITY_DN11303_c0_g1_i1.p1 TRINITY_DN11303_c0_g1~~TRINITY_DN11303_c0_g1_i1.p1  ORF type:complete len:301 (+),score=89.43 TRINITY_DN11303_c0_g1_i1:524-1426(+)
MIVAIKGVSLKGGEFEVEDYCYPGIPPVKSIERITSPKAKYVALVSGLLIGDDCQNPLALQMFVDTVCGHLGSSEEQQFSSNIVRVIVAGNSFHPIEDYKSSGHSTKMNAVQQEKLMNPLREADGVLSQLANSVNVDIMPGESDPSNYTLPQQPLPKCIFPVGAQYKSFVSVTNPYEFQLDNTVFLGTSGQTIDNIERFMVIDSKLQLMQQTLEWRHIAPTAPDLLHCYPFAEADPFILKHSPHVYFIGNQKKFETKVVSDPNGNPMRLIMVPSFAATQTAVLVNLNTLETIPLCFSTDL